MATWGLKVVGSPYPGGGEASKGLAVRQLKRYASWVQTVVILIKIDFVKYRYKYRLNPLITT